MLLITSFYSFVSCDVLLVIVFFPLESKEHIPVNYEIQYTTPHKTYNNLNMK